MTYTLPRASQLTRSGSTSQAASYEQLTKIAGQLPEEPLPLPVPEDLAGKPPWERAGSYVIAGSAADLLTDPDAAGWAAAALDEFTRTPPVPSLTVSPGSKRARPSGTWPEPLLRSRLASSSASPNPGWNESPTTTGTPMPPTPRPSSG